MITLNIETSTNVCSVAATDNETVLYAKVSTNANHAHDLPLFVDEILTNLRKDGILPQAVALSAGPGSYTGLRIGIATAKGLCYGFDIPLIAIDTLQVLCYSLLAAGVKVDRQQVLCPMIDARRMEVYTALFNTYAERQTEVEAKVIDESSFLELLSEDKILFFGNGAQKCKDVITHTNAIFIDEIVPLAENMGVVAVEKYLKRDFVNIAYFAPTYLKEFQATVSHKAQNILYANY